MSYDPAFINAKWAASGLSEGQSIMYSVEPMLDMLKPGCNDLVPEGKSVVLLIDEIDSGLSLDNLDRILRKIKKRIKDRPELQIFLSFNTSFVLKYFPDVISMYDGKVHHLRTEEEMLVEMKRNQKMLDKKRKKSNGSYRIFD